MIPLKVLYADTAVREEIDFTRSDMPITLNCKGRGGTRFAPTFKAINEMEVQPCCVIYFTDLDCSDFGEEPDYPVIWIQTAGRRVKDVPFGEVVTLND